MQKIVENAGKEYKLESEGSAFETGYGVRFQSANGRHATVQFGVNLTSSMELVGIPYNIYGSVSQADFDFSKKIVSEELEANPTVFHIIENGRTERDRLKRSLSQATGFNHITPSDPEAIAIEQRVADLSAVISASTRWAHDPTKMPFKQFLSEYRSSAFEVSVLAPSFRSDPVGPIELVSHARKNEAAFGSIAVVSNNDSLSRVPFAVAEQSDYGWSLPWRFPEGESKWLHLHRYDFGKQRSEQAQQALSKSDTLVLVWTRRTDPAAFERIASIVGRDGNPHLMIGSPEGTFTGRAHDLQQAFTIENSPVPAI